MVGVLDLLLFEACEGSTVQLSIGTEVDGRLVSVRVRAFTSLDR